MSQTFSSLDDRICGEILDELAVAKPELASLLRVAIHDPSISAEDAALLVEPTEAESALGIVERIVVRHGRMA